MVTIGADASVSDAIKTMLSHHISGLPVVPKAGIDLAQAAAQVGRSGTPDQVKQAVAVLEDARRKLYSILAQD